jgi:hypothetical protein
VPVNQSAGPLPDACEPTLLMSKLLSPLFLRSMPSKAWLESRMFFDFAGFDLYCCGTVTLADHWLKIVAGLVLRSIGVVNSIVNGVVD